MLTSVAIATNAVKDQKLFLSCVCVHRVPSREITCCFRPIQKWPCGSAEQKYGMFLVYTTYKSSVLKESDLIQALLQRFTGAVGTEWLLWTTYLVHKSNSCFLNIHFYYLFLNNLWR